ncbi:MAG: DUF1800 domain-containing protein [Sphingobacteriaceae bacterium]|nr:DUF1800 domain-containing protein [Cytophagaceae bacterium]
MALLDVYSKPLTAAQAAHLLRRATFGPTPEQIRAFTGLTADQAVAQLLANQPLPAPPLDPETGKSFHDLPYDRVKNGKLGTYLKNWWTGLMLNQPASLVEKVTLFWSNHFVTGQVTVSDYRYTYQYNALLRQHALGNFRAFTVAVSQNPAMLRYLNGNQNVLGKPNENYARELQELFTIGRGGNYTEEDVRQAARVLTGWADAGYRDDKTGEVKTAFRPAQHDPGDKPFSAAYQNAVIKGRTGANAGLDELNDLVDLILKQPETARAICRELYRWFVNSDLKPEVETGFIVPLAEVFRAGNFEIKPVLSALFRSTHFFDSALQGAVIKAPTDLVLGTLRFFGTKSADMTANPTAFYQVTGYLYRSLREQQQDLLDPPTVFGWSAYYQGDYYQQWINANTLGIRGSYSDNLTNGSAKTAGKPLFDPLPYVKTLSDPSDPTKLVDELTTALMAFPLTREQKDFLIDNVLLDGLPRYEWYPEWNDYVRAPNDPAKLKAVQGKLNTLLQYIFRLAEYQVC